MHKSRGSRRSTCHVLLAVTALAIAALPISTDAAGLSDASTTAARGFLENRGQIDSEVRYYAAGDRGAVYFTSTGPVLEIRVPARTGDPPAPLPDRPTRSRERRTRSRASRIAAAIRFVDARPALEIGGLEPLRARSHFLEGNDADRWLTDVRSYERVVYREVWPGVDLIFRLSEAGVSYEVVAEPGADLDAVKFTYEGAAAIEAAHGLLRLETPLGTIEHRTPSSGSPFGAFRFAGSHARAGGETPAESSDDRRAEARLSPLAPGDPMLGMDIWWSTFLGGARDDSVYGVAIQDSTQPVVVGATSSTDFPTTLGVVDPDYNSTFDIFVTKFSYDGSTALWSTYLGGTGDDRGWAVAVDDSGQPVVAGVTSSADFPVTAGAFDTTYNEEYDAYVTKLSADGTSLVWSTYYGGNGREWDVSGLDLDATGRAVLCGSTQSTDLPTSAGAYDLTLDGPQDAFVAAFAADGSTLALGSYLGGQDREVAEDVVFDSTGRPLIVGNSASTDFPTTAGGLQPSTAGARDGFVTKLAADAGSLVFSTYLGGSGDDDAYTVVLDDTDRVLVTGATTSPNFPTTAGVFGSTYSGGRDVFLSRLSADGATLLQGTYFGGSGEETGLGLVEDGAGRPVFAGWTCSSDFPLAGPPINPDYFTCDGYLARLTPDWSVPLFSSYIGGWRDDSIFALALAELDRLVAGGETYSPSSFPVTSSAFDQTHNSPHQAYDGFVMELLTPKYCTFVSGTDDPLLLMGKAVDGNCPDGVPEGQFVDLVEGRLENVDAVDVGGVWRIACNSPDVVFENDVSPQVGFGLFQLARFKPDGTYTDGAETGLVGIRTIVSGDCP